MTPKWNTKIFSLLSEKVLKNKQSTGREGMSLWELFVLAQLRLIDDSSYDELPHKSNYDNVSSIDDQLLIKINELIIEVGH